MPDTKELFGTGEGGEALVSLESAADAPRRDIVLPVCYRNTRWALAMAHALVRASTGGRLSSIRTTVDLARHRLRSGTR